MHINVMGVGIEKVVPNQIRLLLDFNVKAKNYDEVFTLGTTSVIDFIDKVLIPNNFKKEDLKTKNFSITNVDEYNQSINKMAFSHYLFKQQGFIEIPYDMKLLAKILSETSNLSYPPLLKLEFTNSNIEEFKNNALKNAYKDAVNKANVLADVSNTKIKDTIKIDFKPIIMPLRSQTIFEQGQMMFKNVSADSVSTIDQTFTPTDIEVKQEIEVLFLAE